MLDYKKINFRCGLEIHQELSGTKLFCSCSTDLQEKNKTIEVMRKIRSSIGETGETDIAAKYEQTRARTFIYHGYENEYCLVDTDSEPPHEINHNALKTALEVATLLKLQIPDYIYVMRKVITDGSAVSGFQRSILIGCGTKESYITTSKGKVRIKDLYLEEDACKIIKTEKNKAYYSLSRQGIPLLEIGTCPDIETPEQAKEVAQQIGMILRSFPLTLRGIGTIRQDVNLSIKNGARVEIKGFQDLRTIPKIIKNEVKRQLKLFNKGEKITSEVRKANKEGPTSFLRPMPGAARLYPETDIPAVKITKELLNKIKLPELISDKVINLSKKYNLYKDLARELIKGKIDLEDYIKKFKNISADFIARVLVEMPKEIRRRYDIKLKIDKDFETILDYLDKKEITKEAVFELLVNKAQNKKINIDKYKTVSVSDLEDEIKKIIKEKKGLSANALMGIIMSKYRGKVDGKEVYKIINKFI